VICAATPNSMTSLYLYPALTLMDVSK